MIFFIASIIVLHIIAVKMLILLNSGLDTMEEDTIEFLLLVILFLAVLVVTIIVGYFIFGGV